VDQVFGLLGRLICGQTRDGDIPARHGERSILVYLHCAESEQAQAFGRRLSMLLSREQIDWRGDAIKVSISMGIAIREPGETLDALHQRAGRHLTAAQQAGGKQIVA
jgi:GGDEF domain-containing protein